METQKKALNKAYKLAKEAKVGSSALCPSCGGKFIKTSYQQAFCKTKVGTTCKDNYWNNVTPTKRNNTTRISPASVAYMAKKAKEEREAREEDDEHYCVDGEYM